jgi:hypothetical protein
LQWSRRKSIFSNQKHPYHLHGCQLCNRQLDRQHGTPWTESVLVQGPVSQVLLLVGKGFRSSTTSWRRIWIIYHKSEEDLDVNHKLEKDLDHLPQVRGGQATLHRRAPVHAGYSDFIKDALPLSNGHQGLMALPTWLRGPGHQKGTESFKLPGSAHFSALSTWSGGLGHQMGTESFKLPDPAHFSASWTPTTYRP